MMNDLQPDDPFFSNKMMEDNFKRIKEEINDKKIPIDKKNELKNDPIIVASLDTGCHSSHTKLRDMVIYDKSVVQGEEDDPKKAKVDEGNHGTLVAGIIWRYAGQVIEGFTGKDSVVKLINIKVPRTEGLSGFKKHF